MDGFVVAVIVGIWGEAMQAGIRNFYQRELESLCGLSLATASCIVRSCVNKWAAGSPLAFTMLDQLRIEREEFLCAADTAQREAAD